MQDMPQTEPPEDDGISITDLDTSEKKHRKVVGLLQRYLHFLLQTKRKVLGIAITGAILLLLFVVFAPYLLLPKPANIQKARSPATAAQANAVELAYIANKVIYINTF